MRMKTLDIKNTMAYYKPKYSHLNIIIQSIGLKLPVKLWLHIVLFTLTKSFLSLKIALLEKKSLNKERTHTSRKFDIKPNSIQYEQKIISLTDFM